MSVHSTADKKEAIRKYKERKTRRGIFVIRCAAWDQVWVGASRNLDATPNGYWFSLRLGSHMNKSLQEAWNQRGEDAFQFEILEEIEDDLSPILVADVLKRKRDDWIEKLSAIPL